MLLYCRPETSGQSPLDPPILFRDRVNYYYEVFRFYRQYINFAQSTMLCVHVIVSVTFAHMLAELLDLPDAMTLATHGAHQVRVVRLLL